jgi:hypothetical protein
MTRWGEGRGAVPAGPRIAALIATLILIGIGCVGRPSEPSLDDSAVSFAPSAPTSTAHQSPSALPVAGSPSGPTSPTPSAVPSGTLGEPTPGPSVPHEDASLEALLPSSLAGVPLDRYSLPGSFFTTGGDMCILICGGEPIRYANELGVPVDQVTVALATDDKLGIGMIGYRARGAATDRLIPARIAIGGYSGNSHGPSWQVTIGGRTATFLLDFGIEHGEYLVARDDMLFIVFGDSPRSANGSFAPDGAIFPAHVVEAFAGLP